MTDLFIPAAPKDYVKIPHILASVAEFMPDIERACIVAPDNLGYTKLHGLVVDCFTDDEVMPSWYDRKIIGWRPNWTTQQLLKLTQSVTDTEYWLTIDADTFFNKRVPLFNGEGKPILYMGQAQHHPPYFAFNEALLGIGKLHTGSFLSECTVYKRSFVDDLLISCGGKHEFIRKTIEIINTAKGFPADAEIYAAWVLKHHPGWYEIKQLVHALGGRYGAGEYIDQDIIDFRALRRTEPCQTFSLHSWSDNWK